ncbi:hypothetical protein [Rheinheimera sp.]|uniref:hypothetical protein n=1 Tax=Rheinheimera sp. TaxID=1869214 RepID=UPI0027348843|nr:hypothetical protein [Rheinheimera sp.]MDP2713940.1 hypothetical protein [Rheinheimera sp.]
MTQQYKLPKRWLNKSLVYAGLFGLVFQLCAVTFSWWHGIALYEGWWLMLLAPCLCIASGMLPSLQLQQEPE